jgi:hypothetical protein
VAFDDDRNDVGYLNLDGSVVINNEKYQHWIRGLGTLESEITGCPIKSMPSEKSKFIIPIFKTTL